MTNTTPLSPAAQAVLQAVHLAMANQQANLSGVPDYRQVAAAALRAAAEHLPDVRWKYGIRPDHTLSIGINWSRDALCSIAAELEGAQ